ncbi:hypothetical protein RFI_35104, partial [Reticulomyxa filosa]
RALFINGLHDTNNHYRGLCAKSLGIIATKVNTKRLKRVFDTGQRKNFIGLPRGTTFEQVHEKGVKELHVQLTTYWDYIIIEELNFLSNFLLKKEIGLQKWKNNTLFWYHLQEPLNKVMTLHLPNFQYILNHPDFHLSIDWIHYSICVFQQKLQILLSNVTNKFLREKFGGVQTYFV